MNDRKYSNIPDWKKSKVDAKEASLEMKLQQSLNDVINSKKNVFLEILEIIDDIERVTLNKEDISESWKYLNIIKKKSLKLLEKQSVIPMIFKDNKAKFGWCEVVGTEKSKDAENEIIIREIKKGYLWNDKILRLASVIIVNNKE